MARCARLPPFRLHYWTHLRREGSEGSEGSKGSEGGGGALRAQIIKKPARALRHFDRSGAERNGVEKSPPSDGTGGITAGDLQAQSIIGAVCISPIPAHPPARDDNAGERHWTHLRREGSEGAVPHSDCPTACGGKGTGFARSRRRLRIK